MEVVSGELIESDFIKGIDYWFNDEGAVDIFIADFDRRRDLQTLTKTEMDAAYKRVVNFFEVSLTGSLELDVTTPEYGLVRQLMDWRRLLQQVNFFLVSSGC